MPFMRKIRWDIKDGAEADFRANQEALCAHLDNEKGKAPLRARSCSTPRPIETHWPNRTGSRRQGIR
jgi:hypothetical protein